MSVDRFAPLLPLLTPRYAGQGAPEERVETVARPAANGDPRDPHVSRNRYRVDAAYRTYERESARPANDPGALPRGLRRISSAELLDSMIQRMGGAAMPSAKGVFVDISI